MVDLTTMLQGNTEYPDHDDDLGDSMGCISYGGLMVPRYFCLCVCAFICTCVHWSAAYDVRCSIRDNP